MERNVLDVHQEPYLIRKKKHVDVQKEKDGMVFNALRLLNARMVEHGMFSLIVVNVQQAHIGMEHFVLKKLPAQMEEFPIIRIIVYARKEHIGTEIGVNLIIASKGNLGMVQNVFVSLGIISMVVFVCYASMDKNGRNKRKVVSVLKIINGMVIFVRKL